MIKVFFFFALLGFSSLTFGFGKSEPFAFFLPPKGWKLAQPAPDKAHILLTFIEEGTGFRPSISLAKEKTPVTLAAYLEAVQKIHSKNPTKKWRKLGKFPLQTGEAILTQIDQKTESGQIRMLQLITVQENTAYIVTAAAEQAKMGAYYSVFEKVFSSFTLTSDLLSCVSNPDKKEKLHSLSKQLITEYTEHKIEHEKALSTFSHFVEKQFQELGVFWQALLVKEFGSQLESSRLPIRRESNASAQALR